MQTPLPEKPLTLPEAERAAVMLGIVTLDGLTSELVTKAWRQKIFEAHPDVVKTEKYSISGRAPAERIEQLQLARNTLLRWLEEAPKADCSDCGGTGYKRDPANVFKTIPCPKCGGK